MILLKYILIGLSFALFGTSVGLVGYDVWIAFQLRRLLQRGVAEGENASLPFSAPAARRSASDSGRPVRWSLAGRLACIALAPFLLSGSMSVAPDGYAGVRVSEISGVQQGTLYPGLHLVTPFVEHIATYDLRDHIYATSAYAGKVAAVADSERLNLEAAALRSNPMLIQKMIAERLSDKLQIIMVPMDGKNFFAGDVLKSAFSGIGPQTDSDGDSPKVMAKGSPTKH